MVGAKTVVVGAMAENTEEDEPVKLLREYDSNVFILSSAGKPIYCQHGDESELTSFVGLIQVCKYNPLVK